MPRNTKDCQQTTKSQKEARKDSPQVSEGAGPCWHLVLICYSSSKKLRQHPSLLNPYTPGGKQKSKVIQQVIKGGCPLPALRTQDVMAPPGRSPMALVKGLKWHSPGSGTITTIYFLGIFQLHIIFKIFNAQWVLVGIWLPFPEPPPLFQASSNGSSVWKWA